jgi:hypothetical protein
MERILGQLEEGTPLRVGLEDIVIRGRGILEATVTDILRESRYTMQQPQSPK